MNRSYSRSRIHRRQNSRMPLRRSMLLQSILWNVPASMATSLKTLTSVERISSRANCLYDYAAT